MRGKIAAVCVEVPLADFTRIRQHSALPRCGYTYQGEGVNDGDVR